MKKINSGINLFKLFSMFMIAQLHILQMGGIIGATEGTAAYYHAFFMQNAAFCAVNCYALASGYLMLGKKIRLSRIAGLWLEVFFYKSVLVYDIVFHDVSVRPDDEYVCRRGK